MNITRTVLQRKKSDLTILVSLVVIILFVAIVIAVDTTLPNVFFTGQTPLNGSSQNDTSIYVNLSSSDDSGDHYSFVDFDRDVLLWYRMDDVNASGDPIDSSSYSKNGSKFGNANQTPSGYYGKGFIFDSDGDYLKTSVPVNQNFTTSFWMKPTFTKSYGLLFGHDSSYGLFARSSGLLDVYQSGDCQGAYALTAGTWYFVTLVSNDTAKVVYVNTTLYQSCSSSVWTSIVYIGSDQINEAYNGTVDEFMIFNKSLSSQEIASLYNATANQYYNNFTNLEARTHTFTGYAVDKAENKNQTGQTQVTLTETTFPIVNLTSPLNTTYTTSVTSLNYTFTETNPDKCWYSTNGGLTNSSSVAMGTNFTGITSVEGSNTWTVYCNDTSNNKNSSSVTFNVDTRCYISNCSILNIANQVYTLNASFAPNDVYSSSYCFLINANNITFDGDGFSLTNSTYSPTSLGLFYINKDSATIKNVNVTSSLTAGSNVVTIATGYSNITITNSTFYGSTIFRVTNANNLNLISNTIRDCKAYWVYSTGNAVKFYLNNSQINCPSSSTSGGRFVDVISNSSFTNNTFTQAKNSLEFVGGGNNIQIYNNSFLNTTDGYSLYATSLNNSVIADNFFNETGVPNAIYLSGSYNDQFLRNTLNTTSLLSGYASFYIASSNNISVINIVAGRNSLYNLQVVNTNNFLLQNGLFTQNQISSGEGIHIENVTNGTFTSNTLYNVSRFGFYAYGTLNNINFSNNVFKDTVFVGAAFNSITLAQGATPSNINIFGNNWTNWNVSSADAIAIWSGNNVNVFNNNMTVNFTAEYPIEFEYGITNSSVYGNTLDCHKIPASHAIVVRTTNNIDVYNNYASNCDFSLIIHNGSSNVRVYNNTVRGGQHGMDTVDTSINISYYNNNIYDAGDLLFVYHYFDRNNLYPTNISCYNNYGQNLTYGIQIENASNGYVLFRDNILVNVTTPVFAHYNSTGVVILNVTYNASAENILDTSKITRKWYYRAYVNDTSGNNVSNANVTAFNRTSGYQFNATTDSTGYTPLQQMIDYVNVGGTKTYYSNYTIYAVNSSYPSSASHSYNVTSNNNNYEDVFVLLLTDTIYPIVNVTSPLNTTYSTNVSNLNYTFTETNPDKCWYSTNGGLTNSSSVAMGTNFTGITSVEGSNTWTVYCNDTAGNLNSSSVTFFKDAIIPQISIVFPLNNMNTTNTQLEINYTVSDANLNSCWWTNNSGTSNHSIVCGTNITGVTWNESLNVITIYANDTLNNVNSTSVMFTLDTIPPSISITTPTNNTNTSNSQLNVNYSVSDSGVGLSSCWYTRNRGATNTTLSNCENITTTIWSEGLNNITVYVNDTLNNINSTSLTFRLDTTAPSLSIVHPTNGQSFTIGRIELNYTISDSGVGLSSCWYGNNTAATNITIACGTNATISQGGDGTYTVYMWANDTLNNVASASASWTISTNVPAVSLNNPSDNKWHNSESNIRFNFTATDSDGISACELWGNWTGTWHKNQTLASVSSGVETNFGLLTLGENYYKWNVWCNDTSGLPGTSSWATLNRTFGVDTTFPQINLTYPFSTTYASIQTEINFTRNDANINSCWYSLDGGATNSTPQSSCSNVTGLNSGQGSKTWTIYINDSANNQNSSSVTFFVDSVSPTISLISPSNNANTNNATITFSCSMTNTPIANLTLYVWNSTQNINYTNTTSLSGTSNSTTWVRRFSDGSFLWNCLGKNTSNDYIWGSQNYTFAVDTIVPVINLISPEDNYKENVSTTVNFVYNVTDANRANCSLIFDSSTVSINQSVNVSGGNNTFVYETTNGIHNWSVNCTDVASNTGNSSLRTLNVTVTSASAAESAATVVDTTTGGSVISNIGTITGAGTERLIYRNKGVTFKIEGETHKLMVKKLTLGEAVISVSSNPIEATLGIGKEQKFELNSDGDYDLSVRLNSIRSSLVANFTIKEIHEAISPKNITSEEPIKNENSNNELPVVTSNLGLYFLITVAIVIFIVLVVFYLVHKRITKHPRYNPKRFH